MSSEAQFKAASEHYLSNSAKSFSYENKSRLYGLYKQATEGDVQGGQPINLFSSWKGDRWVAWASCKGMSKSDAKREYCDLITKCDINFKLPSRRGSKTKIPIEAAAAAAATKTAVEASSQNLPSPHFEVNEAVFQSAFETVSSLKTELDAVTKLRFYGLFKQATIGDNNTSRPGMLDPVGGAKWDAWYSRRRQSKQEAMEQYVALLIHYDSNWLPSKDITLIKKKTSSSSSSSGSIISDETNKGKDRKLKKDDGNHETDEGSLSKSSKKKKKNKSTGSLKNLLLETTPTSTSTSGGFNDTSERVSKKGWLHKMQERGLNVLIWSGSDRWAQRYFVLSGGTLHYYRSEEDPSPRGSFVLHRCTVKKEGMKTLTNKKIFHVLALYLHGTEDSSRGPSSGALLRVSSESEELIDEWFNALAPRTRNNMLLSAKVPSLSTSTASSETPTSPSSSASPSSTTTSPTSTSTTSTTDDKVSTSSTTTPSSVGSDGSPVVKPKSRDVPASKPMHRKNQSSYLSSAESKKQNYRGLFNLAGLILFISNLRMFLKNFLTYGLLLQFALPSSLTLKSLTSSNLSDHPILLCYLLNIVCLMTACFIELSAIKRGGARGKHGFFSIFKNWNADTVVNFSHVVNILTVITIPTIVIWQYTSPPGAHHHVGSTSLDDLVRPEEYMTKSIESFVLLITSVVMFMKLISYAHVHHDYRQAAREAATVPMDQVAGVIAKYTNTVEDTENLVRYPYNVSLKDIFYFWMAPTLTYQINFPRSKKCRKWMIASLLVRMFGCLSLMIFLGQQHIMPAVMEATESLDRLQPWHIVERLLSLGIPMTYMWLLMFYLIFHLFLNFLAEILRFGDRVFYKDWWNSNTFEEYWRLWNLPVHFWLVRHLYFPCQRAGLSRGVCVFLVFFFSAALHELIVSVPFHLPRIYAFAAMLGQIPLVALTKALEKHPLWQSMNGGNFLFWCMFCIVGQPMALLLYYYDSHVLYQEGAGSVAGVAKDLVASSLYSSSSPISEL